MEPAFFEATATQWHQEINANSTNTSHSYYDSRLTQCRSALRGEGFADGGGTLCAVVVDGATVADAFIVVAYVRNVHLRMLDVTVRPTLDAADKAPDIYALAWIAATAIVGCLDMITNEFPCTELKIHAGLPLDKQLLTAIGTALVGEPTFAGYTISSQGNWLVVHKT